MKHTYRGTDGGATIPRVTDSAARRLCKAIVSCELPVVLAIAPALLFPTPKRLLLLVVVPFIWACARIAGGRFIPPTPLNAALWLLLTMAGVSLWATFDVTFSLGKLSGLVLGVLLYWTVARWLTTPGRLRLATAGYILSGAGLAVIGLLGTRWIGKFPLLSDVAERLPTVIRGIPGAADGFQPNAVAGCLVLFVPLQIALLASGAGRALWQAPAGSLRSKASLGLQFFMLALTGGTLLLTQSRGAFLGLIVTTGAAFLWYSRSTQFVALLAFLAAVGATLFFGPSRLAELAISQSGPGMAGNISGRLELWSRALYGIQDFPITGMGMNAFRKVMPVLYPTFLSSPDFDVAHAHNHLLQAGLDLGLPGLVAYGTLWILTAALLIQTYRRARDSHMRALAGGLGAGLIAHFVFGMTDAIPLGAKVGVLFWMALSLVRGLHVVGVSLIRNERQTATHSPAGSRAFSGLPRGSSASAPIREIESYDNRGR